MFTQLQLLNLYNQNLAYVLAEAQRETGTVGILPTTKLSAVPNLVVEPTFRRQINTDRFPQGGGFQYLTIETKWTFSQLARVIVYHLTGQ